MKDLIVLALLMPFILFGVFQPQMDDVNAAKALLVQNVLHQWINKDKIIGYFPASDLQTIQNDLSYDLGMSPGLITVQGTTVPQTRGNPMYLKITLPTRRDLVNFLGDSNTYTITRAETATSEALQ